MCEYSSGCERETERKRIQQSRRLTDCSGVCLPGPFLTPVLGRLGDRVRDRCEGGDRKGLARRTQVVQERTTRTTKKQQCVNSARFVCFQPVLPYLSGLKHRRATPPSDQPDLKPGQAGERETTHKAPHPTGPNPPPPLATYTPLSWWTASRCVSLNIPPRACGTPPWRRRGSRCAPGRGPCRAPSRARGPASGSRTSWTAPRRPP